MYKVENYRVKAKGTYRKDIDAEKIEFVLNNFFNDIGFEVERDDD